MLNVLKKRELSELFQGAILLDVKEIYGVRTPTPEWLKHKRALDSCRELGCDPPAPVAAFFETNPLDMHVEISEAVQDFEEEAQTGLEISINDLPENTAGIRLVLAEIQQERDLPVPSTITMMDGQIRERPSFDENELAAHDLVTELISAARSLHDLMTQHKADIFGKVDGYRQKEAERYGIKHNKDARRQMTLKSLCGRYEIEFSHEDKFVWKSKNLEIIQAKIRDIMDDLIREDQKDAKMLMNEFITTRNMTTLWKLTEKNVEHPEWQNLTTLIRESLGRDSTKSYVRFYERVDKDTRPRQILLNYSAIEV